MIDPLRPYWPTNRSIAGLLVRGLCLLAAAAAVRLDGGRFVTFLIVLLAGSFQASLLVFEWMELKRTHRSGLIAAGVTGVLFIALVVVLIIESRSVLVLSVR